MSYLSRGLIHHLFVVASMLLLANCSPTVETRGHIRDAETLAKIKANETSKAEVISLLGTPSSTSNFGAESWYYVTARRESYAFLKPEVTEQQVLRLEFDSSDMVTKVEQYDRDKAQPIDMVERTTPTEGHTLGVLEQILGNVGRFNKPKQPVKAPKSY